MKFEGIALECALCTALLLVGCQAGVGGDAGSTGTGARGTAAPAGGSGSGPGGAAQGGGAGAATSGSAGVRAAGGAGIGAAGAGGAAGTAGSAGFPGSAGASAGGAGGRGTGAGAGAAGGAATGGAGGEMTMGGRGGGASGTSATGGAGGDDRCGVAVYDPNQPPAMLTLSGNLGTHDPSLLEAGGKYYLFATGNGIGAKTSSNLLAWQGAPAVFASNPAWIAQQVPGATNLWAPDISTFGGQYHLYYAASTFGSNRSCIGHATRAALDAGSFADHGSIFCSNVDEKDDYNAIDPNVIVDGAGTPWLAFGSFWSGIKLIRLAEDGTPDGSSVQSLADRPANGGALEGPFIVRRCGYYYLFVSFGACCGDPYDYNVRVGRSTSVEGPYTDEDGTPMLQGGGTPVVQGNSTWTAPGHNAVIFTATGAYNVYHALDARHQNPTLRIAEIAWDDAGWPISAGP